LVVYEHRKSGFSGFAPDISGCIATGDDLQEMQINMSKAISARSESLMKEGAELPQPTTFRVEFPKNSEIDYWVVELMEAKVPGSQLAQSQPALTQIKAKQESASEG
jgi:predicted RNase H-like HicB family nuclease